MSTTIERIVCSHCGRTAARYHDPERRIGICCAPGFAFQWNEDEHIYNISGRTAHPDEGEETGVSMCEHCGSTWFTVRGSRPATEYGSTRIDADAQYDPDDRPNVLYIEFFNEVDTVTSDRWSDIEITCDGCSRDVSNQISLEWI